MVRRIRKRPRSDSQENQARTSPRRTGRQVYLGLLTVFALSVCNYVWGDLVLLRAEGLVLRERRVVATMTMVRVEAVAVRSGQTVSAGEPLLRTSSLSALDRFADLSLQNVRMVEREADLNARLAQVMALLDLAAERTEEAGTLVDRASRGGGFGVTAQKRRVEALSELYKARTERTRLETERDSLRAEIAALADATEEARTALARLKAVYAGGEIRAPVPGTVDLDLPEVGEVVRPGDPIISVLTGKTFVLAYLPKNYLFGVKTGMAMRVTSGRTSARGYVSEILPLSAEVPVEFQTAFRAGRRLQLARIEFTEPPSFPTFASVIVTRPLID